MSGDWTNRPEATTETETTTETDGDFDCDGIDFLVVIDNSQSMAALACKAMKRVPYTGQQSARPSVHKAFTVVPIRMQR